MFKNIAMATLFAFGFAAPVFATDGGSCAHCDCSKEKKCESCNKCECKGSGESCEQHKSDKKDESSKSEKKGK